MATFRVPMGSKDPKSGKVSMVEVTWEQAKAARDYITRFEHRPPNIEAIKHFSEHKVPPDGWNQPGLRCQPA